MTGDNELRTINHAAEKIGERLIQESIPRLPEYAQRYGLSESQVAPAVANAFVRVAVAMTAEVYGIEMVDLSQRVQAAIKSALRDNS